MIINASYDQLPSRYVIVDTFGLIKKYGMGYVEFTVPHMIYKDFFMNQNFNHLSFAWGL